MNTSLRGIDLTSPTYQLTLTDQIVGFYLPPIFIALGSVSNILIIIVLSQRHYRSNSSCLYLRFLAVWGVIYLIVALEVHMMTIYPAEVAKLGDAFCAEMMFFGYSVTNLSSWTVVFLTFSRFIAVVFPLQAARICTLASVKRFQIVNVIIFSMWGLPHIIYQKTDTVVGLGRFACKFMVPPLVAWGYEVVHVTIMAILPFTIIIGFNICIIFSIRRKTEERDAMTGSGKATDDKAVVTLVVMTPYLIHVTFWDFAFASKVLTLEQKRQYGMSQMVAMLFYKIHQCVNFIIYFVACRRFREDFKKLSFYRWTRR
jgi:hypothetical protein